MKRMQGFLFIVVLLFSVSVHAKTASEVFDEVSSSIVVIRTYDATGKNRGFGSGVALASDVIVTNCHVIKDAAKIRVVRQGKEYLATVRHSDWDRDVCSLTVGGINAPAVVTGATSRLKVGARVYAIGAPQGLELTLSEGIISSLRPVAGDQHLQITAPISPGSSGGGLFDEEGRLIGLPTFYLAEGQQLNFAVPVEWITELPKRHKETMKARETTTIHWLNKARALYKKDDWASLLAHALRWTKAQPKEAEAWYYMGIAYSQTGQAPKAIEAFQQTLRLNAEDGTVWYNLGIAYNQTGQPAKAIEALQQALRINPEDASVWYYLGLIYGLTGQTDKEAIEAFQQALRINPKDANVWYCLGAVYRKTWQPAKEIECYKQALRINPEEAETWYYLGAAYGNSGQLTKAIEALQQALRINPKDGTAWYGLGVAYSQTGQKTKVMEVYKHLKALDPAKADEFFNKVVLP